MENILLNIVVRLVVGVVCLLTGIRSLYPAMVRMILTEYEELAEKARYLYTQAKNDLVHYIHHEIWIQFSPYQHIGSPGCGPNAATSGIS